MLAIRLQRLGRKALPVYRLAVQESKRHPSSGRVVAYVGSYNPHTKATTLDAEKINFYLKNGAQPTERVARLLANEKIELPSWVKQASARTSAVRNPDKLRKHQPAPEAEAEAEEAPAEA
ncbi:30S ribosomal protein S16 [Candidatus Saccharibacteria bacterium]|nr:30S ribosomal protein S16 [Candidatus Saccharibacteria bacterium]